MEKPVTGVSVHTPTALTGRTYFEYAIDHMNARGATVAAR